MSRVTSIHRPPFASTLAGRLVLDDFDAIREVSPEWDQRHHQVGRGRQRASGTLAQTPWMQVAALTRTPGAHIRGAPPRGTAILALSLRGDRLHVQGEAWAPDGVAMIRQGGEFQLLAPGDHAELCVSIDQRRLDEASVARWGEPLGGSSTSPFLRLRGWDARRRILATAAGWLRAAAASPGILLDPSAAARMEAEVLGAFLDGVDRATRPGPVRPRRDLARRAESFLRDSMRETIRLEDVCAAVGASSRAVHAAFHDVYGIPPKAYRKALRLSAAREELLRARPGTTVSEVAARWGFFQFGYFSIDYRQMFGERPRETLARGRTATVHHVRVRPAPAASPPTA